jgi:CBS domain-containing protein
MKARDVMTSAVVSVGLDTSTREVAKILRDHAISAVPVVDAAGALRGMVSEGDLIGRDEADSEARRDWWLTLLAEGGSLNADFVASLRASDRRACDVMTSPVVTVGDEAEIGEIARLLTARRIKRVPVLCGGQIVGIVSRADLVGAFAAEEPKQTAGGGGLLAEAFAGLDQRFRQRQHPAGPLGPDQPPPGSDDAALTVSDFRALVADHEHKALQQRQERRNATADQRRDRVAELIDHHVSDESWRALLHRARRSAESGEKEFVLLRFPSDLCSDHGRAINVAEADWPATLRGEAAEIYLRWEHDLKPHGFRIAARVLDFPYGMPGDISLFLTWEE